MNDNLDELVIEVRASTDQFAADLERIKGAVDQSLLSGLDKAGATLERGLLSSLRKGSLGFDDLKNVALRSLDEISAHALKSGIAELFGGGSSGGLGGLLSGSLGALLGLPGRATGGPVAPGRGYLVGERGPELFVPTSAGRVEPGVAGGPSRDVRVAINLASPRGTGAPVALRRSSRQVASAVRRALYDS